MPLAALPKELFCIIADSLQTEDLCSTIEACKSFRDALLAKHWRHAATWAASRQFLLEPARRTRKRKVEIRRSLSTLIHCSSYLGSREAIECAVLFHLIAEATGYQDLADDIKRNSSLADFQLTPPTTISTNYEAPLQPSCEAVVVGYLDAAAKFGAQTVIQYLQQLPHAVTPKKHLTALTYALSIAVTHNSIFAAKQLIGYGTSSGSSVRCVELQVGERKYRPPRGFINQMCIAVLHEHEEMVRFICKDMRRDCCLFELQEGLAVARKYKLDRLEKFLGEEYTWQVVNSPGIIYNLERCGLKDIPRP